ncbi:MAG TPA: FAD-dependent oxidoreductase [Gemmatimonadaceae bacterium]|jgi:NADPH-dependent 2,4-dienoyl-CoA reductase/sulfur reductase-like enzyme/nitrite reductase/ring-hydroxylating ferredoxin subunit
MGGTTTLTGPDFGAGVPADSIKPGEKLVGHAAGDSVLLVRVGDEYFAIGSSCTHYGGPLGEGVVVGDTVRCPWHHACFSVRTGEALCAPALNPVPRWHVAVRDDKVFVTEKIERDPLAPTYPIRAGKKAPERVVIVGAGAAGTAAAEMLRRCGYHGSLTLIDAEPDSPYDRPNLSKDYLAGNAPEEWIPIRPPDFYAQHQIEVVRGSVTRIDAAKKEVTVEGQKPLRFDALLLATGAEPVKLPLPGADQPHVHYLRSLADSRAIIAATKTSKQAVVIGTSFIGLEVAASLIARKLEVHVVAPEAIPLERVLGEQLGRFIKSFHEEKGVQFHLGRKPQSIERNAVVLDDGSKLSADLVVIGVGVRPRLTLAESAGLTIDKGVVVNEYLETSAPGIYAAGDIARWPDPHSGEKIRVEHWVVAQRMGQTAARNILGARERFDDVPFFWSAHYDVSVNYVGHAEKWDSVKVDGKPEDRDVAVRFEQGGKLLALASIYRDQQSLEAEIAMEQATR